jgi:hypothetical protein
MLRGAFGGFAVWFRPKVVRLEYLIDAEDEEVVRRLRAEGHELHWVLALFRTGSDVSAG